MNLPVTLRFQDNKRSQDFKTFGEIRVTADPKGFFILKIIGILSTGSLKLLTEKLPPRYTNPEVEEGNRATGIKDIAVMQLVDWSIAPPTMRGVKGRGGRMMIAIKSPRNPFLFSNGSEAFFYGIKSRLVCKTGTRRFESFLSHEQGVGHRRQRPLHLFPIPSLFFYDIAVMQLEPRTHRAGAESKAGGQQNTYLDIKTVMSSSLGSPARERVVLALIFNIEELYCGISLAISLIDSGTTYRALAVIQGEQTKTSTDKKVGATSKLTTPDLQIHIANFLCVLIVWVYSYEVINYRQFIRGSCAVKLRFL